MSRFQLNKGTTNPANKNSEEASSHFISPSSNSYNEYESGFIPDSPLGEEEVDRRLDVCAWLGELIENNWAPIGHVDDAYTAVARILCVSIAIDSNNENDVAYALGLPVLFVYWVLAGLDSCIWFESLRANLIDCIDQSIDVRAFQEFVKEFIVDDFVMCDQLGDLLETSAADLFGMGRAPFGVRAEPVTVREQHDWHRELDAGMWDPLPWYISSVAPEENFSEG